jgi:protein TonB
MFETTLIASRRQKGLRQRLLALPAAIAIHGIALSAFLVGQLWAVAPAPEPVLPVVLYLPSPPPSMPKQVKGSTPQQAKPPSRSEPREPIRQITEIPSETAKAAQPETGREKSTGFEGFEQEFGTERGTKEGTGEWESPDRSEVSGVDDDKPRILTPDIRMPVPISRVDPRYPDLARKTKTQGVVILRATIDRSGQIVNAEVLKDIGFGCGEAALQAVRQWRYEPATLNGRKISVYLTITVNFQLS